MYTTGDRAIQFVTRSSEMKFAEKIPMNLAQGAIKTIRKLEKMRFKALEDKKRRSSSFHPIRKHPKRSIKPERINAIVFRSGSVIGVELKGSGFIAKNLEVTAIVADVISRNRLGM